MKLSDNNPYAEVGNSTDDICCCYRDSEGCHTPSVWFYGGDGEVFFRCSRHRYPIDKSDTEEGEGPWQEMTRQEIAEEWEVSQVMYA